MYVCVNLFLGQYWVLAKNEDLHLKRDLPLLALDVCVWVWVRSQFLHAHARNSIFFFAVSHLEIISTDLTSFVSLPVSYHAHKILSATIKKYYLYNYKFTFFFLNVRGCVCGVYYCVGVSVGVILNIRFCLQNFRMVRNLYSIT